MKRRGVVSLAVAAAAAVSAARAAGHAETKLRGAPTAPHPCVCVYEGPISKCTP